MPGSKEIVNSKAASSVAFATAISTVKVSPLRTFWLFGNMLSVAPWAADVSSGARAADAAAMSNPTPRRPMGPRNLTLRFITPDYLPY
jgi:hypothetical protein